MEALGSCIFSFPLKRGNILISVFEQLSKQLLLPFNRDMRNSQSVQASAEDGEIDHTLFDRTIKSVARNWLINGTRTSSKYELRQC